MPFPAMQFTLPEAKQPVRNSPKNIDKRAKNQHITRSVKHNQRIWEQSIGKLSTSQKTRKASREASRT